MKDIILLWIQWCWKRTQALNILNCFWNDFLYFDAWEVLRNLKIMNNPLWNYIKDTIDKWFLVDASFICSIFDLFTVVLWKQQSMILDWFPRNLEQAFIFADRMKKLKRDFKVIYLDLSHDEAIKRLSSRKICKSCWSVYNIIIDGDIKECKKCNWVVAQREDDKPEIISKRLELYEEETLPAINYFKKIWKLSFIDANRSEKEIFEDIKDRLG